MLQVFALFTSYSRSALLGLIFSLSIYVIFNDDWKKAFFNSLLPLSCVFLSTILLCPQLMARSQYATIIPVFVTYVIFALAGCVTGLVIKLCNKVSFSDVKSLILMFLEKKKGLLNAAIFLITLGLISAGVIYKYSYLKGALFNLTDEYRLVNPLIAIKMTLAHPFIGTGFSMYLMHMKEFIPPSVNHNIGMIVHNVFMMVSAETGIMGLSCFLILIFSPFGSLRKVRVNKETLYLKVILCTTLFVGMCDMHFLIFVQGRLFFFSLLGLLALSAECSRCPIKQTNDHIVQAK